MSILKRTTSPEERPYKAAKLLLVLFVSLMSLGFISPIQSKISTEYKVKAVFLFNFTSFVEWPADVFPQADAPLVIAVVGTDPFGEYLDETVKGENVNGHPLVVRRFHTVSEIDSCHILYVNTEEKDQLKQIFEYAQARHILTVGDTPNFAKQGGMIRFFPEQNKTRIRINLTSVKGADLKVSSKLLRLAEITEP